MLVQGAGLVTVLERARVLGDSVRQLVPNDIDAAGEVAQEVAAVAKDHLHHIRVPDWALLVGVQVALTEALTGIFKVVAKVNGANDIRIFIVN